MCNVYENVPKLLIRNIAPLCHQCLRTLFFLLFSPPAVSKHFFILFPHPETHKSTPTQPPGPMRALESNFLLIKFTIKGPLMPASATLPFVLFSFGFFYCSISLNYIDSFMRVMKYCLLKGRKFCSLYCSFSSGSLVFHTRAQIQTDSFQC